MSVSKTLERLREGLRAEARKRYGQIGALEAGAALTRGRLRIDFLAQLPGVSPTAAKTGRDQDPDPQDPPEAH